MAENCTDQNQGEKGDLSFISRHSHLNLSWSLDACSFKSNRRLKITGLHNTTSAKATRPQIRC